VSLPTERLKEKLVKLRSEMQRLAEIEKQMLVSPDQQISLTDPDARSMATSGRGSGAGRHGEPLDLTVANGGADLALLAGNADWDLIVPGATRFVFVRPRKEDHPADPALRS
jgi:hypothetical protein